MYRLVFVGPCQKLEDRFSDDVAHICMSSWPPGKTQTDVLSHGKVAWSEVHTVLGCTTTENGSKDSGGRLYYLCSEIKGADHLCGTGQLICTFVFRFCNKQGFS